MLSFLTSANSDFPAKEIPQIPVISGFDQILSESLPEPSLFVFLRFPSAFGFHFGMKYENERLADWYRDSVSGDIQAARVQEILKTLSQIRSQYFQALQVDFNIRDCPRQARPCPMRSQMLQFHRIFEPKGGVSWLIVSTFPTNKYRR